MNDTETLIARWLCADHQRNSPTRQPCAACSQDAADMLAARDADVAAQAKAEALTPFEALAAEWRDWSRNDHAHAREATTLAAQVLIRREAYCWEEAARALTAALGAPCPCGCPRDSHIGEIGCPCALPGEPPCALPAAATTEVDTP